MNERSHNETCDDGECRVPATGRPAVARAFDLLPPRHAEERLVGVFAALADPTRARLLLALANGPLCVCDLADVTGASQSAVSHQLSTLRDLDLVAFEREGRRAVYRLADDHVRDLLTIGLAHATEGETA